MDLIEDENVCSAASKKGKYRQEVKVLPGSTRSVPFIIIPMREGQFRIEVKAAVKDSSLNDGILKMLRVVVRETEPVVGLALYSMISKLFSCCSKMFSLQEITQFKLENIYLCCM